MNEIQSEKPKRKLLKLAIGKPVPENTPGPSQRSPSFITNKEASFMVWREGGDMPKKLYESFDEARNNARRLSEQTGDRFHVLRTCRIYDAGERLPIGAME